MVSEYVRVCMLAFRILLVCTWLCQCRRVEITHVSESTVFPEFNINHMRREEGTLEIICCPHKAMINGVEVFSGTL